MEMRHGAWLAATRAQIRELEWLREMVAETLRKLRRALRHPQDGENPVALGDMLRFSQLQMKLIDQEQELRRVLAKESPESGEEPRALTEAEWLFLEEAIARRKQQATNGCADSSERAGGN